MNVPGPRGARRDVLREGGGGKPHHLSERAREMAMRREAGAEAASTSAITRSSRARTSVQVRSVSWATADARETDRTRCFIRARRDREEQRGARPAAPLRERGREERTHVVSDVERDDGDEREADDRVDGEDPAAGRGDEAEDAGRGDDRDREPGGEAREATEVHCLGMARAGRGRCRNRARGRPRAPRLDGQLHREASVGCHVRAANRLTPLVDLRRVHSVQPRIPGKLRAGHEHCSGATVRSGGEVVSARRVSLPLLRPACARGSRLARVARPHHLQEAS
jgi:hypothetical protein